MKHAVCLLTVMLVVSVPPIALADSDTRTVQAEFDRCESAMERVKRDMLRFEATVDRLKRTFDGLTAAKDQEAVQALLKLENRVDYLRGRIDRSAGQRDKIRSDLKAVSGATCPSCITSSVNLYCRNGETLTREIEEYLADASALEDRVGNRHQQTARPPGKGKSAASIDSTRRVIAAAMAQQKPLLDSCGSDAGKTLWEQCNVNFRRADSLLATGPLAESEQAFRLVDLLLDRAAKKCSGK